MLLCKLRIFLQPWRVEQFEVDARPGRHDASRDVLLHLWASHFVHDTEHAIVVGWLVEACLFR